MTDTKTTVEKRKYERYKVWGEISVMLRNGSIEVGQLINISKGGISIAYISGAKRIKGWFEIYLFSKDHFFLRNMPFKIISDYFIEDMKPYGTIIKKQCGGQFGKLTPSQISQLDYFITNHTIDKV